MLYFQMEPECVKRQTSFAMHIHVAVISNSDGRLNVNVTRHIVHIQSIVDEVLRQY